jgi:hypothetical protein
MSIKLRRNDESVENPGIPKSLPIDVEFMGDANKKLLPTGNVIHVIDTMIKGSNPSSFRSSFAG